MTKYRIGAKRAMLLHLIVVVKHDTNGTLGIGSRRLLEIGVQQSNRLGSLVCLLHILLVARGSNVLLVGIKSTGAMGADKRGFDGTATASDAARGSGLGDATALAKFAIS